MSRTKADNDRIDRLASEKRGGGGLVLPPLFSALMNELLDHGTATDDRMAEIVAMECESKTAKLDETWDGDWSFLTRDLMDSLSAQELVARNRAGAWMVGPEFEPGILTEVLPARKNLNAAQSFTAWDAETRAALRSAAVADAKFYEAIRQPRGKFHGPDTLRALRESYEREGPRDPVLVAVVDGYEVVIDGRHRLELDAKWPKKVLHHVTTREQAIGAIIEADDFVRTSVLPTKARAKLAELIEIGRAHV